MGLRETVLPCIRRPDIFEKLRDPAGRWNPGCFTGTGTSDLKIAFRM